MGNKHIIKKTSWFYTFKNWYLGGPFFFNILLFKSSPERPAADPVLPAPADHVETDLVRTRGANIREAGVPGRPGIWDGDGSKVPWKLLKTDMEAQFDGELMTFFWTWKWMEMANVRNSGLVFRIVRPLKSRRCWWCLAIWSSMFVYSKTSDPYLCSWILVGWGYVEWLSLARLMWVFKKQWLEYNWIS